MSEGEVTPCPDCGEPMRFDPRLLGKRARRMADYAFQCPSCGTAYSNAQAAAARRVIRPPERNVPPQVRDGLRAALAGAANIRNRKSKALKFGSENSEDAVTWTVFSGLAACGRLDALPEALGETTDGTVPSLVLWGSPVSGPDAEGISEVLSAVSDALDEEPASRSEPDVIVAWGRMLVFAEAKYHSHNDLKRADYRGWDRYLRQPGLFSVSPEEVRRAGFYELVRNWVIGNGMAVQLGKKRFVLVNLGPDHLSHDCQLFSEQVAQTSTRSFAHLTWSRMLSGQTLPTWLEEYAAKLGLGER